MNAIITGGTKGIGRAIAAKLASNNYNLVICSRNTADLNMAKEALDKLGAGTIHTMQVDVSKKEEVLAFAEYCKQSLNQIDVLINNACLLYTSPSPRDRG